MHVTHHMHVAHLRPLCSPVCAPPLDGCNRRDSAASELEDFMSSDVTSSLSVSPSAHTAATCYAALIAVSGSLGTGAVDTAALASTAAMMKRWSSDMSTPKAQAPAPKPGNKRKPKPPPPPPKRARRGKAEDDANEDDYEPEEETTTSAPPTAR